MTTVVGRVEPAFSQLEPSSEEHADDGRSSILIDGSTTWRRWFSDLYQYSGALRSLAWRNVRSRYKQAALGMAWAVVQPAVQLLVFTVLFGRMLKAPSGGAPYPVFALVGLLAWNLFTKIVSDGALSMVANQSIITKLFFPRIYLVLASGASALLDALVTSTLLVILLIAYHIALTGRIWLAFPALAGVLLFSFGFASLLAAINAKWRDVQHVVPFMIQVGLFVTPVIYASSFVPQRWQWILGLNPLTGLIAVLRAAVLGGTVPSDGTIDLSLGICAFMTVFGVWFFRRSETTIVDVV